MQYSIIFDIVILSDGENMALKIKKYVKYIDTNHGKLKLIILDSRKEEKKVPGLLWIHGGGYFWGFPELVRLSSATEILKNYETVVVSVKYRLANSKEGYPNALYDCYDALLYMKNNAQELGINAKQLMIGGESAGGGLCLATSLYAKDKGEVEIAYQMPLYPMIDCDDTESSRNNHGLIWNTRKNHIGWKKYLGKLYGTKDVPYYASPAKLDDYKKVVPMYTFVGKREPFYCETLDFVKKAQKAGIDAKVDVYDTNIHSFDMALPFSKNGREARRRFLENYKKVLKKYLK